MSGPKDSLYNLHGRVFLITGGAGLMGRQHSFAVAESEGIPVVADIDLLSAKRVADEVQDIYKLPALACECDVTDEESINRCLESVLDNQGRIDGLVNNAANNEKMEAGRAPGPTSIESFPLSQWESDIAVGLTGAFLCSRVIGTYLAHKNGGVIVNISSDLGLISPDQRIYEVSELSEDKQVYKPVSYSVTKHAIIGLTKYLATYWGKKSVRVNALCPGGIYSGQPDELVEKLTNLVPMDRMATDDEYRGAIQFLCSDASRYMTGTCLIMDGGRTAW